MTTNVRMSAVAAGIGAAAVLVAALAVAQEGTRTKPRDQRSEQVRRGEYLVTVGGCHDCHTPMAITEQGPAPDMKRSLSGHPEAMKMPPAPDPKGPWAIASSLTNTAWAGPWGVSFTANLTPDKETGLGRWTEQQFIDTLRTGRHMGRGRPILPPMPWQNYGQMTDQDLRAVFAYLRSIEPIKNRVPDPRPAPGVGGAGKEGAAPRQR